MKSMKAMLKRFTQKGPGDEEITAAINEGLPAFKDMLKDMLKPAGPTEEKAMPQSSESAADDAVDGVSIVGPGSLLQCSVSAISMTAKGSAAQETPSTPLKSLPVGKPGTLSVSTNSETKSATGGEGVAKDRVSAYESVTLAVASHCPSALKRSKWCVSDFDLRALMYNGNISMVYHAVDKRSGITVALKLYKRHKLTVIERHQVAREIKLHVGLAHDAIIAMYAAWKDRSYVYLALEWAPGGDVYSYLRSSRGRLAEDVAVSLILEPFLSGLAVIHAQGLIHRDIKPENILFTADMRLKLCDFGLAINMREERAVTRAGTLEYMAPEVLNCPFKNKPEENKDNERLHYSYHVDTWAVGVLTYELLVGLPPFNDKQRNAVEDKIRGEVPRFPSKISELARDFILRALEKDPIERPTIMDMLNHRWIKIHRRSSSVRQLRPQGEGGAGKEDGAGALGALSPAGGAGAKKKPPNSQFEDIAEEDHLASSDNLAKSSKPPSLLHAAVGGSANPAQHLVGPPSSTSVSSHATNTTKDGMRSVALSAKSFTAGALPKGAFDGLVTPAEVAAAKAVASGSKATSRTATKDFEAV
mmetsp:Transcript_17092/g.42820  ORF Transcript_17092/g.42820 Transcript_17092/m.42820 type:complete len:588 (-) Transcript_17092:1419-3182(-)